MNCARNDNEAKYLRKCAKLAISTGLTEDAFVAPFVSDGYKKAARAAYQLAQSSAAAIPKRRQARAALALVKGGQ